MESQAEQEAKEKAEQEHKERVEKELKEQEERLRLIELEVAAEKQKAEQEAKERAEHEAQEQAEQEEKKKLADIEAAANEKEKAELEARRKIEEEEEHDRITLTTYLRENYPDRLGDAESLLKEYKGHLDILFEELAKAKIEVEAAKAQNNASSDGSNHHDLNDSQNEQKGPGDLHLNQNELNDNAAAATSAATIVATTSKMESASKAPKGKNKKFLDEYVSLEDMLRQFYSVFAPSKVNDVPSVMKHFEDRESDLIHTLELKYNVTFMSDGTCTPNDASAIGEPFVVNSKFAVDVQKYTLRERLQKAGAPPEKVKEIISNTSEMM